MIKTQSFVERLKKRMMLKMYKSIRTRTILPLTSLTSKSVSTYQIHFINTFPCLSLPVVQEDVEELKKRIKALEDKPAPPAPTGDGKIDMNQFYNIFAMKTPPESTIDRIVALENQAKEMTARMEKNEN